jgi:hypothetical protein
MGDAKIWSTSRPLGMTSLLKTADSATRRKSLASKLIDDTNHRESIFSHPINDYIDESCIYTRGVKSEARICKVHFTAWRRNVHRGCEDENCTLNHDPRDWPIWCAEMVPSGPMKELLEIQRDIDIVLGKGEFDVDTALARIKPSVTSPSRARNKQHDTKKTMLEGEDLRLEELVAKGRRIQQIWDEAMRMYRLRKESPDESRDNRGQFNNIQYHPAQIKPGPISFFGDDDSEDQHSNQC